MWNQGESLLTCGSHVHGRRVSLASPKTKERLLISGGQKRRGAPGTSHKQLGDCGSTS